MARKISFTIPDEARRPLYATVGAADVAVKRVRGAVATVQDRVVETQKSWSDHSGLKATLRATLRPNLPSGARIGTIVSDNLATASSAYAEFSRRGATVIGRVWPDAVKADTSPAGTTRSSTKASAKAAPKAGAPKAGTSTRKPASKAATKRPVKVAAPKPEVLEPEVPEATTLETQNNAPKPTDPMLDSA
ncbi:MAG: hypothetical protein ACRCYU_12625 [Nocardioides sp.]